MRDGWKWLVLLALAGGLFLADLAFGSAPVPLHAILDGLLGRPIEDPAWRTIFSEFRLPKALTAALAGASLAVSGLLMQTLFRNPLAGPYVLGISSGASLGVAIAILAVGSSGVGLVSGLGVTGDAAVVGAAAAGAAVALGLVLLVSRRVSVLTLLILGMLFGYASSAVVTILLHWSRAERIESYVRWTFGSFAGVTWSELVVLAPALLFGLGLAFVAAKPLDALHLGEVQARALGTGVGPLRTLVLVATALLAGGVTAFCGPIGFIGVAVPHLARALFATSEHRRLLPATALCGVSVALAADLVSQLPGSQSVLPLNAVTAILGTPVIAALVLRRRLENAFR
ncbi:MAG: iron ABC transporter permease [Acidobacteriota bacterium]